MNPVRRADYMMQLIIDRLTGQVSESYTSKSMQHGKDTEHKAREMYVLNEFDADVVEVGFIKHPEIEFFGASPDSLVNDEGLLEMEVS